MQRLKEQRSSPDPVTARAAALLSAMPPLDAERLRPRSVPFARSTEWRTSVRIKVGLSLAFMLGSLAATAATLRYAASVGRPPATVTPAAPQAVAARQLPSGRGVPASPSAQPSSPPDESADKPAPPPPHVFPTLRAPPAQQPSASKQAPRAAASVVQDDESALMVEAVRALRRDGNAARARVLAEELLVRYPQGAQTEEAMALAMEAASASHDAVGARRAAERYVSRFGDGRFADRAQRILAPPAQ
jgi:hypothetical protein